MKVSHFEITDYELKISGYKDGRRTEYVYAGLPKSLIIKFLSCKTAPDMSDVQDWVQTHLNKQKKSTSTVCCGDFWNSKE